MPSTMLLTYPLPDAPANADAYAAIVSDLLLTGDLKQFRLDLSKTFGSIAATTIYGSVAEKLLGSAEARFVWRAVAYALRHKKKFSVVAKMFGLDVRTMDDVVLCASDRGILHVRGLAYSPAVLDPLSPDEERTFLKQLMAYARRVAFAKLKFLSKYDTSTDMDDYVQTLLVRAMATVWRYAHFPREDGTRDSLKTLNYAKASVHNTAMSVIRARTLESRARIRNNIEACGTCPACKRDEPMQCYHAAPAYEATTISVDSGDGRVDTELSVGNEATEARIVLAKLISKDARVAKAMMATFGSTDVRVIVNKYDDKATLTLIAALKSLGVSPSQLLASA